MEAKMADARRTLIVDDERLARTRMRRLLAAYEEVEIVGEAKNVAQAAQLVDSSAPDLIFLDIQMPGGCGLDLFELCNPDADVVLVTAHNQHAIRAFEEGAMDYLLKPVTPERLAVTMERLRRLRGPVTLPKAPDARKRISVIAQTGLEVVSVEDILYILGADDYSEVFLKRGGSRLSLRRLAEWEARMADSSFFRIHRSIILNADHLLRVERSGKSHFAVVEGVSERFTVARRRVRDLEEFLERK